jgi:hypothetical protein
MFQRLFLFQSKFQTGHIKKTKLVTEFKRVFYGHSNDYRVFQNGLKTEKILRQFIS